MTARVIAVLRDLHREFMAAGLDSSPVGLVVSDEDHGRIRQAFADIYGEPESSLPHPTRAFGIWIIKASDAKGLV